MIQIYENFKITVPGNYWFDWKTDCGSNITEIENKVVDIAGVITTAEINKLI